MEYDRDALEHSGEQLASDVGAVRVRDYDSPRRFQHHGVLATAIKYRLQKMRLGNFRIFSSKGKRLEPDYYEQVASSPGSPRPRSIETLR